MVSKRGRVRRLLFVAIASVAGIARTSDAAPATEAELSEIARRCVLRLDVEREGAEGAIPGQEKLTARGSAVILSADPPEKPKVLLVATAYHVLLLARSASVYASDSDQPIAQLTSESRCYVDRSRELALLEVTLDDPRPNLRPIDTSAILPGRGGNRREKIPGMAFGYARFHTLDIESSQVDFWGILSAR